MKKIFILSVLSLALVSCGDGTSFVFQQTADNDLPNCVAAYKKDGKFHKIADLGDLSLDKFSPEVKVKKGIDTVYFFTDLYNTVQFVRPYVVERKKKNLFKLLKTDPGVPVFDKTDPTRYPQ